MGSLLGLLGVSGLLDAAASVVHVRAKSSKRMENSSLLHIIGDLLVLDLSLGLLERHAPALLLKLSGRGLEHLSGGVGNETLLGLELSLGEHDKLASVGLKSGDVLLELLLGGAGPSVINGDAELSGLLNGDTSGLELLESEATAEADLTSILAGRLGDDGPKGMSRSGEDAGSLGDSILVSLGLLSRLVEVALDAVSLPMLAKMHVDNHIVMLDHC